MRHARRCLRILATLSAVLVFFFFFLHSFDVVTVRIAEPTTAEPSSPTPSPSPPATTRPSSSASPNTSTSLRLNTTVQQLQRRHLIGIIRMAAGRLGNEMFVYAAVLGISTRNAMLPVYRSSRLRDTFDITAGRKSPNEFAPTTRSLIEYSAFQYDTRFDRLDTPGDVIVIGFFQSWKYFADVRSLVVSEFRFHERHRLEADRFLHEVAAEHRVSRNALYVGVHVRRGDLVVDTKYSMADDGYLGRAVERMTSLFPRQRLVYIVCSDDIQWSREHFPDVATKTRSTLRVTPPLATTAPSRNITDSKNGDVTQAGGHDVIVSSDPIVIYSVGRSAAVDLAIMSSCNHTIMTVGTYGWWAGYLAGGVTIYYRDFIKPGSPLYAWFSQKDFFLPEWIGL